MKYLSFKPLDIADSTANIESAAIDLSQIYKLSVQVTVGAGSTMTGSIQLQVSNDEIKTGYLMLEEPTAWSNLGSPLALSAVAASYLIPQQDMCYRALKVVFTGHSGNDASVSVKIMALAI